MKEAESDEIKQLTTEYKILNSSFFYRKASFKSESSYLTCFNILHLSDSLNATKFCIYSFIVNYFFKRILKIRQVLII